jgi:hypothetical protein
VSCMSPRLRPARTAALSVAALMGTAAFLVLAMTSLSLASVASIVAGLVVGRPDLLGVGLGRRVGLRSLTQKLAGARGPVAAALVMMGALGLLRQALMLGAQGAFPSWTGTVTLLAALAAVAAAALFGTRVPARGTVAAVLVLVLGAAVMPTPTKDLASSLPINTSGQQRTTETGMLVGQGGDINGYDRKYLGRTFEQCDMTGTPGRDCFRTYFIDLALREGFDTSVAELLDRTRSNNSLNLPSHCHEVAHELGKAAAYVVGVSAALGWEPQICGTGFTHGVFQKVWGPMSDDELRAATPTICADMGATNPYHAWTCHHILGHTVLARDMLNPSIAVDACMKIEQSHNRGNCITGAWMEFFSADVVADMLAATGDPAKVMAYCLPEPAASRNLCVHEVFATFSRMTLGNDRLALQWCVDLSPTDVDRIRCIEGVGRGFAVGSAYRWQVAAPKCSSGPAEAKDWCLAAAAASIVLNTGSLVDGRALCTRVTDPVVSQYCEDWVLGTRLTLEDGPNKANMPD